MDIEEDVKRKGVITEIIQRLGKTETNLRKIKVAGNIGPVGPTGPPGAAGATGAAGANGSNGTNGTNGTNGVDGAPGGTLVLFDHYADAGNGTTVETDLYSDTLAAGQLVADGDKIDAKYGGLFVSSATATRQLKVKFAGTTIFDSGALTLSVSDAWTLEVLIIRVSATIIRYAIQMTTEGAALSAYTSSGELTGLTLSNTNILKITGQAAGVGAATNDIVAKLATVIYIHLTSATAQSWVLISDLYASAADQANFDFTSIPATYKHLKILFEGRSDRAGTSSDAAKISLNNDTGNNYVGLIQWGAGQTEQATAAGPTAFAFTTAATSPASWFSNSEITLFDYANTNKFHGWQARGMQAITNSAGNYFIYDAMGLYLSAVAISRVTLYPNVGANFKRYSRATLFGLV